MFLRYIGFIVFVCVGVAHAADSERYNEQGGEIGLTVVIASQLRLDSETVSGLKLVSKKLRRALYDTANSRKAQLISDLWVLHSENIIHNDQHKAVYFNGYGSRCIWLRRELNENHEVISGKVYETDACCAYYLDNYTCKASYVRPVNIFLCCTESLNIGRTEAGCPFLNEGSHYLYGPLLGENNTIEFLEQYDLGKKYGQKFILGFNGEAKKDPLDNVQEYLAKKINKKSNE